MCVCVDRCNILYIHIGTLIFVSTSCSDASTVDIMTIQSQLMYRELSMIINSNKNSPATSTTSVDSSDADIVISTVA